MTKKQDKQYIINKQREAEFKMMLDDPRIIVSEKSNLFTASATAARTAISGPLCASIRAPFRRMTSDAARAVQSSEQYRGPGVHPALVRDLIYSRWRNSRAIISPPRSNTRLTLNAPRGEMTAVIMERGAFERRLIARGGSSRIPRVRATTCAVAALFIPAAVCNGTAIINAGC